MCKIIIALMLALSSLLLIKWQLSKYLNYNNKLNGFYIENVFKEYNTIVYYYISSEFQRKYIVRILSLLDYIILLKLEIKCVTIINAFLTFHYTIEK